MPIPSNTTAGTAIDITSLPYSNTQQVDDAGTTYEVWYKYTAPADGVIGVWGFGDLSVYTPRCFVYSPNDATQYLSFSNTINKPLVVPVENGVTYWFQFFPNAGNPSPANFEISVLAAPTDIEQIGDFFVNNDEDTDIGFWATVLRGDLDNTVRKYAPDIVHGEQGQILESGRFLLSDDINLELALYDGSFNLLANPSFTVTHLYIIGLSKVLQLFYVCHRNSPIGPAQPFNLTELDEDGVPTGNTWVLTAITSIGAAAVNNDASILYFSPGGASNIKRWDLVTPGALSDLVATTANHTIRDLIYLEDDIIVALLQNTSTAEVIIKTYDTSGTELNSFSFGTDSQISGAPPRLAFAIDSPNSVWLWIKLNSTKQVSKFHNVKISDGTVLSTVTHVIYQEGIYSGIATATPEGRFGSSLSCPFLVLRVGGATPTGTIIVNKVVNPVTADSFDFTAGGGLAPGTFSLIHGGSQTFLNVPVGSGYSIVETADADYVTTYEVSNDPTNDNTNISVGDGETVTVTVTNTQKGSITVGKMTDPNDPNTVFDFVSLTLTPDTWQLMSDEARVFSGLTPGNLYDVEESPLPQNGMTPTYLVSNGSPIDAITVAPGENVTVVVLNSNSSGGLRKITPGQTNDVGIKIPDPFFITAEVGDK